MKQVSLFDNDSFCPPKGDLTDGNTIFDNPNALPPRFNTFGDNLYWSFASMQTMWIAHKTYKADSLNSGLKAQREINYNKFKSGEQQINGLIAHNDAKRFQDCCWYCERDYPKEKLTKDHVFPRTLGGEDAYDNIIYVCPECNSSKRDKDLIEWFVTKRKQYPHYWLIFYYLKEVHIYAVSHSLMNLPFTDALKMQLPFNPLSIIFFQDETYMTNYLRYINKTYTY